METIGLLIFCSLLAILLISSSRPSHIVVVREPGDPTGCLGGFLSILVFIGVFAFLFLFVFPADQQQPAPPESGQQVGEKAAPLINQAPPIEEQDFTQRDTYINMPPRSRAIPPSPNENETVLRDQANESSGTRNVYTPEHTLRYVVLVKRFTDRDKAMLLQQHFSQWGMRVLHINDRMYPYWNCVFIETEAEGLAKIREWNRYRKDFNHMGLELIITKIKFNNTSNTE